MAFQHQRRGRRRVPAGPACSHRKTSSGFGAVDKSRRRPRSLVGYQADRLPQAKAFFDRSLAADPKNTDTAYSLALLEAELGNAARSLVLLRTTVGLAPDFGRAWYNLGLAEAAYGDLPASAKALEKAESLLPRSSDPAFALATVQLRMKDPAKAAESARRALAIAPGHPGARGLLRQLRGTK